MNELYEDTTYEGLIEDDVGDSYPQAGVHAQPEVQMAVERFLELPADVRNQTVLLWWLLGSGTPPYKQSKPDSEYTDRSRVRGQTCANCAYAYQRVVTGQYICSQMRGEIRPEGWCKWWEA